MKRVEGFQEASRLLDRRLAGCQHTLSPRLKQSLLDTFGVGTAEEAVDIIIKKVRFGGDEAILELVSKIDGVHMKHLEVSRSEVEAAVGRVEPKVYAALEQAARRIKQFHDAQSNAIVNKIEVNGCYQVNIPLRRVGVYAPGGSATYPSSVLMTAIPAKCAGVKEVVLATPPGKDGKIPDITLAAASIAGADRIFAIGGAQAIAALAYGTQTVPAVDKICGPGNVFVMLAKKQVFGTVDIDGLQGPSEVLIITDEMSNPGFIADEILAQAEHDSMAQSVLVTTSGKLADQVSFHLEEKLATASRADITGRSIGATGIIAVVSNLGEAVKLANMYAPEHLVVDVTTESIDSAVFTSAGCIFTGKHPTVPMGDYVCGPSHALPTGGTARFSSPLNVGDFTRCYNVVNVDDDVLRRLGPSAIVIARSEGLAAHAKAVENRLDSIGGK